MTEQIINARANYDDMDLRERMKFFHCPGISVAVYHEYELVLGFTLGEMELGSGHPITEATLFQAASISKPVFAATVLRLWEEGVLDIYRDVNQYLADYQVIDDEGQTREVTFAQLLSHSAGMNVHGFEGYAKDAVLPGILDILNGKGNSPKVVVDTEPGLRFRYSGGGYTVAQKAVEDVTGRGLAELVEELVFRPCRMEESGFEHPPTPGMLPLIPQGHYYCYTPVPGGYHLFPESAAAGVWTTPADLCRFGIGISRSLKGGGLLRKETAELMLTPQKITGGEMGLGFFLMDGGRFVHGGDNDGFTSRVRFTRDGSGAAVMTNSNESGQLITELMDTIAQVYHWNLSK